jgi:ankyrin repeat protein
MNDKTPANFRLHFVCLTNNVEEVINAINNGADVNCLDIHGQYTPLLVVTNSDNLKAVEILLENGANTELSWEGYTPLLLACSAGYLDIAQLLIKYGANLEARDNEGHTPVLQAFLEGKTDVVNYLLAMGANHLATTYKNETAEQLALKNGHSALADYFKKMTKYT